MVGNRTFVNLVRSGPLDLSTGTISPGCKLGIGGFSKGGGEQNLCQPCKVRAS